MSNPNLTSFFVLFIGALVASPVLPAAFAQEQDQTIEESTGTIKEELADVAKNATQAARSIGSQLSDIAQEARQRINIPDVDIPNINFPDIDLVETDPSVLENLYNLDWDLEQSAFPPAIIGGQRDAPEYTIDIPHTPGNGTFTYEPAELGIPVGTTIMWINKDSTAHTVTTAEQGHAFSPPVSFDSGYIPGKRSGLYEVTPFGGSIIYTFDKPGVYDYFCTIHQGHTGRIIVGDTIQIGQEGKLVLMEGANLPFDSSELSRILLAVVPTKEVLDLPPTKVMSYNVSISGPAPSSNPTGLTENSENQVLYSTQFLDTDGVLYLELIPQPQVNGTTTGFTTWGPDISGTATGPHTGAFHIKGPVLVQNEPYTLTVSIVNIDEKILEDPVREEFILSSKLAGSQP